MPLNLCEAWGCINAKLCCITTPHWLAEALGFFGAWTWLEILCVYKLMLYNCEWATDSINSLQSVVMAEQRYSNGSLNRNPREDPGHFEFSSPVMCQIWGIDWVCHTNLSFCSYPSSDWGDTTAQAFWRNAEKGVGDCVELWNICNQGPMHLTCQIYRHQLYIGRRDFKTLRRA